MVVIAAGGVEGGVARGTAGVGLEVGGDGELGAAGTAEDGLVVPFGLRPGLDGMVGEGIVAVFAGVVEAAASHFDSDDVERRVVMKTAGLGIEIQATDIGSGWRHWMKGGSRVKNSKLRRARGEAGRTGRGWRYHCCVGMCYKSRAVKSAAKQELAPGERERAEVSVERASPGKVEGSVGAAGEDASRYCPVCSQRLESRRCKLNCPVCGYYMSCADYY